MSRVKKIFIGILIALGIIIWIGWDIVYQYYWAGIIVKKYRREGWELAASSRSGDLALIWTWIKCPVTLLVFIKRYYIYEFNPKPEEEWPSIILLKTIWVHNEHLERTVETEDIELIDCKNNRFAIIEEDKIPTNEKGIFSQDWHEIKPDTPIKELASYVCIDIPAFKGMPIKKNPYAAP